MARLAYYAPGVYVEEIASARQPIAGVGTNTVGFIGLVKKRIHVPVANPDYDPILAKTLLDYIRLTTPPAERADPEAIRARTEAADKLRQKLEADLASLKTQADKMEEDAAASKQEDEDKQGLLDKAEADERGLPATASDEDKSKAGKAVEKARKDKVAAARALNAVADKFEAKKRERDDLEAKVKEAAAPAPAAATGGGGAASPDDVSADGDSYSDIDPSPELLVPSKFRPYYLVPFDVKADEFATKLCTNFSEYTERFGDFSAFTPEPTNPDADPSAWTFKPLNPGHHLLTHAVSGFFNNGGTRCFVARVENVDHLQKALDQFESIDDVAILAAPGLEKTVDVWDKLQTYCEKDTHQNVFAILDSPSTIVGDDATFDIQKLQYESSDPKLPRKSTHAAFYFPHIEVSDPAKRLQDSDPWRQVAPKYRGRTHVAPSGHVAGIYARTDEERGVHKAPANATVRGALEVKYYVGKPMQEMLNPQGVNCIRLMGGEVTVWGARTIGGDRNGEWKYVSVRRFAGFLEESIEEGTQWVVFEPNDPNLWSRIILNITAFLTNVWRSGALFGLTPQEAFYVKCDAELNPPEVRDLGQVITEIGVAIVRPAEFVIFRITQSTGERRG